VDGRIERSARTRAAIAEAMLALYHRGVLVPTVAQIAEAAGVSVRCVHHHYNDREAVIRAVAQLQHQRTQRYFRPIPADKPFGERLRAFVRARAALLEAITPVRRGGLQEEPTSPFLQGSLGALRKLKREQVGFVFAPELDAMPERERASIFAAAAAAASWSTWEELRTHQKLSVPKARAAMARTLRALLAGRR
jgi:AcrR family transcriptional regulator